MRLPIRQSIQTYILVRTVSMLLQITGQIFVDDREIPPFSIFIGVNIYTHDYEI